MVQVLEINPFTFLNAAYSLSSCVGRPAAFALKGSIGSVFVSISTGELLLKESVELQTQNKNKLYKQQNESCIWFFQRHKASSITEPE